MLFPCATRTKASAPDSDTDDFCDAGTSGHVDDSEDASATNESEVTRRAGWVDIADAAPMPQPNYIAIRPRVRAG
jgi:hypothetical protein